MNTYYEKNIEAIKKINKVFYDKLLKQEDSDSIEIVNKKNFLVKQGSKELLAYLKGKEYVSIDNSIKAINMLSDECTIQIGIGNGYMLKTLLQKSEKKHLIILIEPITKLLNFAFNNFDYSKYITDGRLVICSNKEELPSILSIIEGNRVIQLWHSIIENYTVFLTKYYSEITKLALDTINQIMCNTGTVIGAGAIIAENDIKNLPYVIKHRGIIEIKDLYKNKPAVVILSAPTVVKLLPQLLDENIRKKIIIIAIAQMLRPLLAFGIKPDFICTVDYGGVNYEHFDNLWHVKDVPLVALNRSYAPILQNWQGSKLIVTGFNPAHPNTVVEMLNNKGQLEQGGSVGHMALGLSIHLGCNPVIHIGFDCAYDNEEGLSHNKLGDANGKINFREDGTLDWDVTDPNSPLKNDNHKMGNIVYVPGYFGNPVPTNMGLASFVTAMENIFKTYPHIKFINSCEGGAKKKYCEQMSFKKALKTYCKANINKNKIKKYLTLSPIYKDDIIEAKKRLKWEIKLFNSEIKTCRNAIKPLDEMENATGNKLKELLTENEKYAIEAQEIAKQSNLLSLHIYKTSREIHKRELKVNGKTNHLLKDKDDLKTRIKRSRMILEAAKESSITLKGIYVEVLKKLKNDIKEEVKQTEITKEAINNWSKLLENGNWARPLLESEYIMDTIDNMNTELYDNAATVYCKALEMKVKCIEESQQKPDLTDTIEYNKYIELSKEAGLKKEFKTVLKYLKEAQKINPQSIEVLWGMATVYHHTNKIRSSKRIYEKLLQLQPENKRFKFEYGQVILMLDIQKGMQLIKDVMSTTNEFDSFYIRLAELEFGMENYGEASLLCNKYLNIYSHSNDGKNLLELIKKHL